jgi:hypothetical protein
MDAMQSFNHWMNGGGSSSLLIGSIAVVVVTPVLVLVHELGHAGVGLLRTEGLVAVRVGRSPARWRFRTGRLQLDLNPLPARNAPAGLAAVHARIGIGTKVTFALAGPFAEAAAAFAIVLAGVLMNATVIEVIGGVGIAAALSNLVPREHRGIRSDGGYLLDALRGHTQPPTELSDTYSRWLVLFSDDKSSARTPGRAKLLGGAPLALGYGSDGRADPALGLWRLAFAGWCWREVERSDPAGLRDAALDALHAATIGGAVEPDLTAVAAQKLANTPVELDAGFTQMSAELCLVATENERRFAFRYGVALREIERIRS